MSSAAPQAAEMPLTRGVLIRRSRDTLAGNAVYALAQLGVLLITARLLGTDEVGRYALVLAMTAPIQVGFGMKLRIVRVVGDPDAYPLSCYVRVATVSGTLAALISSITSIVIYGMSEMTLLVIVVAASKAVESVLDVLFGELQRLGATQRLALHQLARGGTTVSACLLAVLAGGGLLGVAVAIALVWTSQLVGLMLTGGLVGQTHPAEDRGPWRAARQLVATTWTSGLAGAVSSVMALSPRYVIAHTLGTSAVGLYAVLSSSTTALSLLDNSLAQASLADLRGAWQRRDIKGLLLASGRSAVVVSVVGTILIAIILLTGHRLLPLLFGPEFRSTTTLAALLMAAAVVTSLASIASYVLYASGWFAAQPMVSTLSALVGVGAVIGLTTGFGLNGSAVGVTIMFGTQLVSCVALCVLRLRRRVR